MTTGSFWKTALTYAFAGPPLGGLVIVGWLGLWSFLTGGQVVSDVAGWLLLAGIFYGYVFGLLPAFLTGVLSAVVSSRFQSWRIWAAISCVIGYWIAALALSWMGLFTDDLSAKVSNGFIGAIPAIFCAWLSRKHRPLRSEALQTSGL